MCVHQHLINDCFIDYLSCWGAMFSGGTSQLIVLAEQPPLGICCTYSFTDPEEKATHFSVGWETNIYQCDTNYLKYRGKNIFGDKGIWCILWLFSLVHFPFPEGRPRCCGITFWGADMLFIWWSRLIISHLLSLCLAIVEYSWEIAHWNGDRQTEVRVKWVHLEVLYNRRHKTKPWMHWTSVWWFGTVWIYRFTSFFFFFFAAIISAWKSSARWRWWFLNSAASR